MTLTPEREVLELEYGEVCRSHAATVDFRGKLLALLPIASGAGIFLLLDQRDPNAPLGAIGLFGSAVTLGLFIYETRNIDECNELIKQGGRIEETLGVPSGTRRFSDKPKARLNGLLGATGAGWIVYNAVFFSWLYLAAHDSRLEGTARWLLPGLFALVLVTKFAVWPRTKRLRTVHRVSRLSEGARRDLLHILTSPAEVRADLIRQFHERPEGVGIADVLIDLETDEQLRVQVIDVLRQSLRPRSEGREHA